MTSSEHPADRELAENLELAAKFSRLAEATLKPVRDREKYLEEAREVMGLFNALPEDRFRQIGELIKSDPEARRNLRQITRMIEEYNNRS